MRQDDLNSDRRPAGAPIVRLDFAVDRLARQSAEVLRSSSAIGSEIGGLLLGTVSLRAPVRVTVRDYELIACNYVRGPFYKLDKSDLDRLDQAIARHDRDGRALEVVGYFRSHTRQGTSPDADDLAVCSSRFHKPHQIAMLVRPGTTDASEAGVFVWQDGELRSYVPPRESHIQAEPQTTATGLDTAAWPPQETPRRAAVVPIVSRRPPQAPFSEPSPLPASAPAPIPELPALPAAPAAPPVKASPSSGEARVGRCVVKVRLAPDPRRSGHAPANPEAPRRGL
jgi:hypothetical protein